MDNKIEQTLRVNHAGEYGAVRIYAGQLAVLKDNKAIQEMANHEADHLEKFNQLLIENYVRPTVFQPLWHVAAYVLGWTTAKMGEKAAHACTIAIESVIDDHYRQQLIELKDHSQENHQKIKDTIDQCHQEELLHKKVAIEQGGEEALGFNFLSSVIKVFSKTAIWLSSRF